MPALRRIYGFKHDRMTTGKSYCVPAEHYNTVISSTWDPLVKYQYCWAATRQLAVRKNDTLGMTTTKRYFLQPPAGVPAIGLFVQHVSTNREGCRYHTVFGTTRLPARARVGSTMKKCEKRITAMIDLRGKMRWAITRMGI
jgi:hypothetical protein